MIGGIDIPIPTLAGPNSTEVAVRAIRQKWPHAEYENGLTGERYSQFCQIPFGEVEEIFVYRDHESADRWEAEGAVPSLQNAMIHLVADHDLVTLVLDVRDAEMDEIVAAVESALGPWNKP